MPDKLNLSPNERVDIPDMFRAANEYTSEVMSFELQKLALGDRSHLLEGFRVRIINDPGNPPTVIVYNGNALDRNGKHLNNEANSYYSQQAVLADGPNTTYYLELVFIEDATTEDARAFWDPTLSNASPIPDGREFNANVKTRITPTWLLVSPVNTTSFDWSISNPTSVRIPLMRLRTDATNQILDLSAENPGLETSFPSTVLTQDYDGVGTRLKVADARLFSDVPGQESITIDPDSVYGAPVPATLASIDKDNNILTLTVAAAAYVSGTTIRASGLSSEYVQSRSNGSVPSDASTHPDNASRLFQGSEERGAGLSTDREDGTDRSDLELRNLKDQVDFLAAQVREMKWGALRPDIDTTETVRLPPRVFDLTNDTPRYYDKSRGIAGAGTYVITVGDGITSYGDFNGSDHTGIQAAVDAANSNDTIFIKDGNYVCSQSILITKSIRLVGAGRDSVTISQTSAGTATILLSTAASFRIEELTITCLNTLGVCVDWTDNSAFTVSADNCNLTGSVNTGTGFASGIQLFSIKNCLSTVASVNQTVLFGDGASPDVTACEFENNILSVSGAQNVKVLKFGQVDQLNWKSNTWIHTETTADGSAAGIGIECGFIMQGSIDNTSISCLGSRGPMLTNITRVGNVSIDGVHLITGSAHYENAVIEAFIGIDGFKNLQITNVYVAGVIQGVTQPSPPVLISVGQTSFETNGSVEISNCFCLFDDTLPGNAISIGADSGATYDLFSVVKDCYFFGANTAITAVHSGKCTIERNYIDGGGTGYVAETGIRAGNADTGGPYLDLNITNNLIKSIEGGVGTTRGITLGPAASSNLVDVYIHGNHITEIGHPTFTSDSIAIYVQPNVDFGALLINNNNISKITAASSGIAAGVFVNGSQLNVGRGYGFSIRGNYIDDIGSLFNSNLVFGIATFLGSGSGSLYNTSIEGNTITNANSTGINNNGIILSQSGGQLVKTRINNNTIEISSNAATIFGSGVSVLAQTVTGLDISSNYVNGTLNTIGVGSNISLVATGSALADGGSWHNVKVDNNILVPGVNGGGSGTKWNIRLVGTAGTDADSFTTFSTLSICGNHTEGLQDQDQTGSQHHIQVLGRMFEVRICNNSTIQYVANAGQGFIRLETPAASPAGSRVVINGNVGFGLGSLAYTEAPILLSNISEFTMGSNSWNVAAGAVGGIGRLLAFIGCTYGTITGNLIVAISTGATEITFLNSNDIIGSGNSFGPFTGGAPGAVPAVNNISFELGDASAILAGGTPLNLNP